MSHNQPGLVSTSWKAKESSLFTLHLLERQTALFAGHVILPLELLQYKSDYHAAVVRAFGGSVIVKDDATAAQVVTQFRLACITLDGKISRPGSMQVNMSNQVTPTCAQ